MVDGRCPTRLQGPPLQGWWHPSPYATSVCQSLSPSHPPQAPHILPAASPLLPPVLLPALTHPFPSWLVIASHPSCGPSAPAVGTQVPLAPLPYLVQAPDCPTDRGSVSSLLCLCSRVPSGPLPGPSVGFGGHHPQGLPWAMKPWSWVFLLPSVCLPCLFLQDPALRPTLPSPPPTPPQARADLTHHSPYCPNPPGQGPPSQDWARTGESTVVGAGSSEAVGEGLLQDPPLTLEVAGNPGPSWACR